MFAKKLKVEMEIESERTPVPMDWLDAFCMRNFTGSGEFDDTLPVSDGKIEAGLSVDEGRLGEAMSEWFSKRGKGGGKPVKVDVTPLEIAQKKR